MSDLSPAQREAMERAWGRIVPGGEGQRPNSTFKEAFLAGLRYQDEPSEAEVEAAARAIDAHQPIQPAPVLSMTLARAALNAAKASRESGGDSDG